MKKNILIVLLLILLIASATFAYVQKSRADRLLAISQQYLELAEKLQVEIHEQRQVAIQEKMKADASRMEVLRQMSIANQQNAKSKK